MNVLERCFKVLLALCIVTFVGIGCTQVSNDQVEESQVLEIQSESKLISEIILLQYSKEISSWRAQSPMKSKIAN